MADHDYRVCCAPGCSNLISRWHPGHHCSDACFRVSDYCERVDRAVWRDVERERARTAEAIVEELRRVRRMNPVIRALLQRMDLIAAREQEMHGRPIWDIAAHVYRSHKEAGLWQGLDAVYEAESIVPRLDVWRLREECRPWWQRVARWLRSLGVPRG